ncbi:MAG: hypothetical protein LBR38_06865 [Synergistaceae bacterium]|jgi:F0F1-type ATP synthase membrane subunit b/b'|nr:hypothetical protein [Synergistaceae bacterium]
MSNRAYNTLIALIVAGVVSLSFLVVRVTPLFLTAYGFALLGIAALWLGANAYVVEGVTRAPWVAVLFETIMRYLVTELVFSAICVAAEQFSLFITPILWFLLIHGVIAAFFSVRLLVLKGGKEYIEGRREAAAGKSLLELRTLTADVAAMAEKAPEYAADIRAVAEALRYSDPVGDVGEEIRSGIARLKEAVGTQVAAECTSLLRAIKDRNNRVRISKK